MNIADSQRLRGILKAIGYEETDDESVADLILFNTCCVRQNAEQRLLGRVQTLISEKKRRPGLLIGVAGCLAQNKREKLMDLLPMVDLVFGPNDMEELPLLLQQAVNGKALGNFVNKGAFDGDSADGIILSRPFSAMVNIIRGCTNFCSYCIVPYVRGPEVSRPLAEVINFIKDLAKQGVKEITLLGQNVNAYGKDLGLEEGFATLLSEIEHIDGIEWVRFMTSHPRDFSSEAIHRISKLSKVCEHFHLPVQAGSNTVLKNMKRGYTRERYKAMVKHLRREIPDAAVTTDIICGFPGESEEDFNDTLNLVKDMRYDTAFMYYYSPREDTEAQSLDLQVPKLVRKERLTRLIELQNGISVEISQTLVGKTFQVLVEGVSNRDKTRIFGKTRTSRTVDFPGDKDLIGRFVDVKITEARNWTLSGIMVK